MRHLSVSRAQHGSQNSDRRVPSQFGLAQSLSSCDWVNRTEVFCCQPTAVFALDLDVVRSWTHLWNPFWRRTSLTTGVELCPLRQGARSIPIVVRVRVARQSSRGMSEMRCCFSLFILSYRTDLPAERGTWNAGIRDNMKATSFHVGNILVTLYSRPWILARLPRLETTYWTTTQPLCSTSLPNCPTRTTRLRYPPKQPSLLVCTQHVTNYILYVIKVELGGACLNLFVWVRGACLLSEESRCGSLNVHGILR